MTHAAAEGRRQHGNQTRQRHTPTYWLVTVAPSVSDAAKRASTEISSVWLTMSVLLTYDDLDMYVCASPKQKHRMPRSHSTELLGKGEHRIGCLEAPRRRLHPSICNRVSAAAWNQRRVK